VTGPSARIRTVDAFAQSAQWFLTVVSRVGPEQWDRPGLGVWTVRELVGHTGRALSTVEDYLVVPEPGAATTEDDDPVVGAALYFMGLRDNAPLHQDVAERGRQAGAELPDGPGSVVLDAMDVLATRVLALVLDAPDDAAFKTRFGARPFSSYLLTRAVELVVHSVDLATACGSELDVPPLAASAAVAVIGELAVRRDSAGEVIAALAGRVPLRPGFGVFD
jgi:uncharacterized protein (TIGR03083 family)